LGKFWQNILHTPKKLPAPTPMRTTADTVAIGAIFIQKLSEPQNKKFPLVFFEKDYVVKTFSRNFGLRLVFVLFNIK